MLQFQAWSFGHHCYSSTRPARDAAAAIQLLLEEQQDAQASAAATAALEDTTGHSADDPTSSKQTLAYRLPTPRHRQASHHLPSRPQPARPLAYDVLDSVLSQRADSRRLARTLLAATTLAAVEAQPADSADQVEAVASEGLHTSAGHSMDQQVVHSTHSVPEPATSAPTAAAAMSARSPSDPGTTGRSQAEIQPQEEHPAAGGNTTSDHPNGSFPPPSGGNFPPPATSSSHTTSPHDALPAGLLCSLPVVGVEHHARSQLDLYSRTAFVDFLAFLYVALFYQVGLQVLIAWLRLIPSEPRNYQCFLTVDIPWCQSMSYM